jgi:hypothetical protein
MLNEPNRYSIERVSIFRIECNLATRSKIHEFINDDPRYRHAGSGPKVRNLRVVRDRFSLTLHVFGTKAVRELTDLLLELDSVKVDP